MEQIYYQIQYCNVYHAIVLWIPGKWDILAKNEFQDPIFHVVRIMCCVISGEDKNNMSRSYNSKCKIGSSINFEISFEENGYTFRGGNSVKNIPPTQNPTTPPPPLPSENSTLKGKTLYPVEVFFSVMRRTLFTRGITQKCKQGVTKFCSLVNNPLFQQCQVYDWPPFFKKKYMNGPIFLDSYLKGPIFLTSWYMHIFFAPRFFEAAYPLGII